ncbi:MAG: NAD(P)-dependent oxidoreductase [Gammaproteobacteria bacterium]|nr:NAD(P)-dependent oxidoreductase [Gammaproteobacteria bacterium]
MAQTIGFIGLGAMGDGMSKNLLRAGFTVRGFDIERPRVDRLVEAGGAAAGSAREAAEGADVLVVLVFTAAQAEDVLFGADGAMESLPKGATVVMHTTMSPGAAQAIETRLADSGHALLDAPITGGTVGADEGTLTIIVSGSEQAMAVARPAFEAMGRKIAYCGAAIGAGSTVKMINQMMCGILVAATAEGISLAARAGADPNIVYDVIASGAARSLVWESRVPTILARDFTPRGVVEIFTKDLDIVLEAGKALDFPLPMTAMALQQFLAAAAMGHGRDDDGAVVKVYEQLTGVDVAAAAESGSN